MGLMTYLFGRKDAISHWGAIADFIDANAAFQVNRTMYDYSRARAGAAAGKLMSEPTFLAAIEAARWAAFPTCVGNMAELVDGELRPQVGAKRPSLLEALVSATRDVQSRYPVPESLPPEFWETSRGAVEARLRLAALAEPKSAIDVPVATFSNVFDLIPIHPSLREIDYTLVLNQVKSGMCAVLDEFRRRADVKALVGALPVSPPSPVAAGP